MGGLARRASLIKQIKKAGVPTLLVDGGDVFGAGASANGVDEKLKAEYLLKGMELCGYDALNVGEADFRFGETFLAKRLASSTLSATSANIYNKLAGTPYAKRFISKQLGGRSVLIIGALDPTEGKAAVDASQFDGREVVIKDAAASIASALAAAGNHDLVIVMAQMSLDKAKALAPVKGVDLIVVSDGEPPAPPEVVDGTMVISAGYDGKWLVYHQVLLNSQGAITDVAWKRMELDQSIPDDPQLAALYQDYLARLKTEADAIAASIAQKTTVNGADYVGSKVCGSCHQSQVLQWSGTKHAHALETLRTINQDYNPACLACHSTGFGFLTGFLLPDRSGGLTGVQCEVCHGPASEHVNAPVKGWSRKTTVDICKTCHTSSRSPKFTIETYLPKVTH